jgi:hypothetical protein
LKMIFFFFLSTMNSVEFFVVKNSWGQILSTTLTLTNLKKNLI